MKQLKGKATICLYNKDKQMVYKKVEHNAVTDAVKNLVNQNYTLDAIRNASGDVINTYTPIWKNFAGLLLFKDELDDDIIIPNKGALTGFTGQGTDSTHYDSSNIYHGQPVAADTIIQDEYCKFKYVFPAQHVPGTISAVALTSTQGGNNGLQGGNGSLLVSYSDENLETGNSCGVGLDVPSSNFIPYIKTSVDGYCVGITEDGKLVTIKTGENNTFVIKLYAIESKVNFTKTFHKISSLAEYETQYGGTLDNLPFVTLKQTYSVNNKIPQTSGGYITFTIDDMKKSTILGSTVYIPKIASGGAVFTLLKLVLNDDGTTSYSYCQLNMTSTITYSDVINNGDFRFDNNKLYVTDGSFLYVVRIPAFDNSIHNGNIFDKIQLVENNITPLLWKDTIALMNTSAVTSGTTRNLYFLTNSNILAQNKVIFGGSCDKIVNFCFNFMEPVLGIITETNGVATINTNVFTSYLATINNISSVTKYSTLEMTVTYEIYTEDYKSE